MKDLRIPLGIDSLEIESQESNSKGEIIITVTTKQTKTPCHKCGKPATKPCGYAPYITIKHTSLFDTPVYLRIRPMRYQCERCDDRPATQGYCAQIPEKSHRTPLCPMDKGLQRMRTKNDLLYRPRILCCMKSERKGA